MSATTLSVSGRLSAAAVGQIVHAVLQKDGTIVLKLPWLPPSQESTEAKVRRVLELVTIEEDE